MLGQHPPEQHVQPGAVALASRQPWGLLGAGGQLTIDEIADRRDAWSGIDLGTGAFHYQQGIDGFTHRAVRQQSIQQILEGHRRGVCSCSIHWQASRGRSTYRYFLVRTVSPRR